MWIFHGTFLLPAGQGLLGNYKDHYTIQKGSPSSSPVWLPSTPRCLFHLETTKDSHIQLLHTCWQALMKILNVANKTVHLMILCCKCRMRKYYVQYIGCALCSMVQGRMQCGVSHGSVCGVSHGSVCGVCVCPSVHCCFTEPMGVAAVRPFGVTMTTALGCLSPSTVTS